MKQKQACLFLVLCLLFGCTSKSMVSQDTQTTQDMPITQDNQIQEVEEKELNQFSITINNQSFPLTLYDNETTASLKTQLPLSFSMDDLHGNEKYHYFDQSFPSNSEAIQQLEVGDVMLFGSDCLVLFYQSFSNSYTYTPVGKIKDQSGLLAVLGQGRIEVVIQ